MSREFYEDDWIRGIGLGYVNMDGRWRKISTFGVTPPRRHQHLAWGEIGLCVKLLG
jgi:hypothetical protein